MSTSKGPDGHTVCTTPAPNCNYLIGPAVQVAIEEILKNPRSTVTPAQVAETVFIHDEAITNIGFRQLTGLDFTSRYDFDLGDWGAFHVGWRGTYELTDTDPGGSKFDGNTGGRFPWRARVGWSQGAEGFYSTLFLNHLPHSGDVNDNPPKCYYAAGFTAGDCYTGSRYFGPQTIFYSGYPGMYVWDLNLGYNTGEESSNSYLQNLSFNLNIQNLLDQEPPFNYEVSGGRGEAFWDASISPLQRYFTFTVTKTW